MFIHLNNNLLSWNFLLEFNFSAAFSDIFFGSQYTCGLALVKMKFEMLFCDSSHFSNSWTRPILASRALILVFLCSRSANKVLRSFCSLSFSNRACSSIFLSTWAFLSSYSCQFILKYHYNK